MRCLEIIRNSWPVAYARCGSEPPTIIPLAKHLKLTADLMAFLFKYRFGRMKNVFTRRFVEEFVERINLEDIVYSIGLLHDLGKSSLFYRDRSISVEEEKIVFTGHEHVISCILVDLAHRDDDEFFRAESILAAKVISRHHSAMMKRHPSRFTPQSFFSKITSGMCNDEVVSFIERQLTPMCKDGSYVFCERVLASLSHILKNKEFCDRLVWDKCKPDIHEFHLSGLGIDVLDKRVYDVYKIVSVITGILVLADNLAATYEGRVSDEGASSLYVSHWENELSPLIVKYLGSMKH